MVLASQLVQRGLSLRALGVQFDTLAPELRTVIENPTRFWLEPALNLGPEPFANLRLKAGINSLWTLEFPHPIP
jgi:hypothetical protein